MVSCVEQILTLQRKSETAKTPDAQARLQRQIDRPAYELYAVAEKEIRIVEDANQAASRLRRLD